MQVRVIPERSGWMIQGDVVLVSKRGSRIDPQQDVIRIACRTDPQSVSVHVCRIEAVGSVHVARTVTRRVISRELVD